MKKEKKDDMQFLGMILTLLAIGSIVGFVIGGILTTKSQDTLLEKAYSNGIEKGKEIQRELIITSILRGYSNTEFYFTNENTNKSARCECVLMKREQFFGIGERK